VPFAEEAEDRAVAFIEQLGGQVTRDANLPGMPVVAVHLDDTHVTDAGLKELAALKQLRELTLWSTNVTDEGLKELASLKQLQRLDLVLTNVSHAGVAQLQKALPMCDIDLC
jgi:hypothetical protein